MTAITRDANGKIIEIPSDIATVEQLLMWCASTLEFIMGNETYNETIAGREYYVSLKKGRTLDGTLRVIPRVSLALDADYPVKPQWKAVQELSSGTIPASYQVPEAV